MVFGVTLKANIQLPQSRLFAVCFNSVDARKVEQAILAFQEQVRGPAPKDQLVVMEGKEPKHGSGASILSAVTVPAEYYLGSAVVEEKTNEIPVARELFAHLNLEERRGSCCLPPIREKNQRIQQTVKSK